MATNNYFHSNYAGQGEQTLIKGLMREAIQQQGYDIYYMPREKVNFDYLFGEDAIPDFKKTYKIEAYIKDVSGYGGKGHVLSKLGLDVQDEITIQIAIERFNEVIKTNEPTIIRPREGDLIYFGLDRHSIFEISFVENKTPFFQLGELYLYEIDMKRFVYGAQTIDTGIPDIDEVSNSGATVTLTLGTKVSSSANYLEGEIVYQYNTDNLTYRASGEVISHVGNTLTIHDTFGTFLGGLNIKSEVSMTEYTYPIKDDSTFDDVSGNPIADNIPVKQEGLDILNNQESNPFIDF